MGNEPEHSEPTRRNRYRYLFLGKHHGGGSDSDGQWLKSIRREQEFAVFDNADWNEIADEDGWLYGVWQVEGELQDLGTRYEQIAAFPFAKAEVPWHGYPSWALGTGATTNRKSEKMRPSKTVFEKLERSNLITAQQRSAL